MFPLLALGLLVALGFAKQIQAAKELKITPGGLPRITTEGNTANITMPVKIANASKESFLIDYINGVVSVNGSYFGRFTSVRSFTVPPMGTVVTYWSVSVPMTDIIRRIVTAVLVSLIGKGSISVRGNMRVNKFSLPFTVNYSL